MTPAPTSADLLDFADAHNITAATQDGVTHVFAGDGQKRIVGTGYMFSAALLDAWHQWQAEVARRATRQAASEHNMTILDGDTPAVSQPSTTPLA